MSVSHKQYSQEDYVSKVQLKSTYSASAADLIYKQVLLDRELYKYPLPFSERPFYVTMNATLIKKMCKIYDLQSSLDYKKHRRDVCESTLEEDILCAFKENNTLISPLLLSFLCGDEPFLVKLFVIFDRQYPTTLIFYFLRIYNHEHWFYAIQSMSFIVFENIEVLDLTLSMRHFCENLYLQLVYNMVPFSGRYFYNSPSYEELALLHPQLSAAAIAFYRVHSNTDYHYTIADYKEYCHVSYESARQSMHYFVSLKMYTRLKIGKKYVYVSTRYVGIEETNS